MISKKYLGLFAMVCLIGITNPGVIDTYATTEPKTEHDLWQVCNDTFGSSFLSDFFCGPEPPKEQRIIR